MLSMVTMATAAALLILYPGDAAQEDWCDSGWNTFTTTCFKLFTEPKSWSAARTYCEEMDGNLLSVNATPGLERVTKGMRLVNEQSSWWTGWHKRIENKTVIDLDARISFLNQLWGKGEPNHRYKEDCAEININGTLRDVRCNRNNNYICIKFSISGQESTQTIEDCGPGWFLMHRACYKLSTDAMTWESAKKNCEVDGGYLLSVSSVAEMNLIKKEMRKANRQNTWWVGLQRAAPYSKTWVWLDSGSPFSARVTRWSPSEPNNQSGRENCVEITLDGTLSDKDCEEFRPFVCERHEITPRLRLEPDATSVTAPVTTTKIISLSTIATALSTPATTTQTSTGKDQPDANVTTMSSSGSSSLSTNETEENTSNSTVNCGINWFLISSVCLKLSTKTVSWSQAQESCKLEGGNLMSTSTLHELIEVQTLTNLGGSRWWIGEQTTSLKCVAISSSGSVHVEDCNAAHPYICEKRKCRWVICEIFTKRSKK